MVCIYINGPCSSFTYRRYVLYENLKPGNYTFSVQPKDSAGNLSDISTIYFVLDEIPPVISNLKVTPNPAKQGIYTYTIPKNTPILLITNNTIVRNDEGTFVTYPP